MSTSLSMPAWKKEDSLYQSIEEILADDQVSEEDVDQIFKMAVAVKDPFQQIRYFWGIISKYLAFPRLSSHRQAYHIAITRLNDGNSVEKLLKRIANGCREMKDANAIILANEIDHYVHKYLIIRKDVLEN